MTTSTYQRQMPRSLAGQQAAGLGGQFAGNYNYYSQLLAMIQAGGFDNARHLGIVQNVLNSPNREWAERQRAKLEADAQLVAQSMSEAVPPPELVRGPGAPQPPGGGGGQTPGRLASPPGGQGMAQAPIPGGNQQGTGGVSDEAIIQGLRNNTLTYDEALAVFTQRYGRQQAAQILNSIGASQSAEGMRMDRPQRGQAPPPSPIPPGQDYRTQPPANAVPTAQPRRITGPETEAGTGFQAGGPAQTPGYTPSISGGIEGEFGELGAERSLEDFFGTQVGRGAQFTDFISGMIPNASPRFREIAGGFIPEQAANAAFQMSALLGGTQDFGQFLPQLGSSGGELNLIPSQGTLGQVANILGQEPSLAGQDPLALDPVSMLTQQLRGDQLAQLDMATAGGITRLPVRYWNTAQDMVRRAFDQILAREGMGQENPGDFQFLKYLADRGFRF